MPNRDLILILGCGRSGTSAITRVLSLCGGSLPESVFGPRDMNPRGFWEPIDATKLNLKFLIKHGSMLADPALSLEANVDEGERDEFIESIRAFLRACPNSPMLVLKCPGVVELFDYWLHAAQLERLNVKVVIPLRHPGEVLASLIASGVRSAELTAAFWLTRNLLAERHSRGLPRVVVSYADFVNDWRAQVARLSSVLAIDMKPDERAIGEFLSPDLHRNRCSGPVEDVFAYSWISRVYAILSSAAQDGPMDLVQMDEIYTAYQTSERAFRMARNHYEQWSSDPETLLKSLDDMPVWRSGRDF